MEAVGLASSILTFLDVSYKIVRGTYEIRNAVSGATSENTHVGIVAQDLEEVTDNLNVGRRMINDPKLFEISRNCHRLSQDLANLLEKLQAKDDSRRESFKAAWAVMRKQSDVKKIEERLDQYRSEIQLRLLVLICARDSASQQEIQQIRQMSIKVNNQSTQALENLQSQLGEMLRTLQAHASEKVVANESVTGNASHIVSQWTKPTMRTKDTHPSRGSSEGDDYSLLIGKLDELKMLMEKIPYESNVLRRLCFESILSREGAIKDAVADTYEWMLHASPSTFTNTWDIDRLIQEQTLRKETATKFMSFLKEDGQTFFITGRAGCGKSTLMKFLGHHDTVMEALETWADERKLVVVGMYFWSSDDPLQKSLRGFYRSILYHTLKQCPELISLVFPATNGEEASPDSTEYQMVELKTAFSRLIELKDSETHKFCYFIDGMDEYDGDTLEHRHLAKQLVEWADSQAVKIVCSARPYTVFLDVFERVGITTVFHNLTRSDIRNFAKHQFNTLLDEPKLAKARETCLGIVADIVLRAKGVFLWAYLVVRSLINGALEHEDVECLRKRLQDCPNDLNGMFRKILDRINSSRWNRHCSNVVLYLATHNPFRRPLNALIYSWLRDVNFFDVQDADSEFPFNRNREPLTFDEVEQRHQYVRDLLPRTTNGLLEMSNSSGGVPFFKYRVDFFHRSVRDFLKEEWTLQFPGNTISSTLQDVEVYSRLRVAEAKFCPCPYSHDRGGVNGKDLVEIYKDTFTYLKACERRHDCVLPFRCIEEFGDIASLSRTFMLLSSRSSIVLGEWQFIMAADFTQNLKKSFYPRSFIHYASFWSLGSYVRERVIRGGRIENKYYRNINLLLTASIMTDCETTRLLLSRGWRPSTKVEIKSTAGPRYDSASVWMVLLLKFASTALSYRRQKRQLTTYRKGASLEEVWRFAEIIEAHLRAGADRTVYFLVGNMKPEVRVDLYQMVEFFQPPNMLALHKLLRGDSSWKNVIWNPWKAAFSDPTYEHLPSVAIDSLFPEGYNIQSVRSKRGENLNANYMIQLY